MKKKQTGIIKPSKGPSLRKQHHKFNENDPALHAHFEKIVPDKRLKTIGQLRAYLEKRYQRPVAEHIANLLAPEFDNFRNSV